eukprot:11728-Heterococcus_DN1.PRE.3
MHEGRIISTLQLIRARAVCREKDERKEARILFTVGVHGFLFKSAEASMPGVRVDMFLPLRSAKPTASLKTWRCSSVKPSRHDREAVKRLAASRVVQPARSKAEVILQSVR